MQKSKKLSFSSKGIFPYNLAFTLLIPIRNLFLSPKKLLERLFLEKGNRVLEVGCGPGYFSPSVAYFLSEGTLVLADIQKQMLDIAKKRMKKKGICNIEYYLCNGEDFEFNDNEFDRIFLVTAFGEVENKIAYIHEFFRLLKPDGLISISELWGDPDKITSEQLKDLFESNGFKQDRKFGGEVNYTLNFRKAL